MRESRHRREGHWLLGRRTAQRVPGERPGGGVLPPELIAMFQDIDEQGRSLKRLLEQPPVVAGGGVAPPGTGAGGRQNAPPATVHRETHSDLPGHFLLPDGSSIDVGGGFPAVDAQGRSGLHDRVNHTARVFGNALLLPLLSAGFAAAQPDGELRLSTGELAVQDASRELKQAAGELLRRGGEIPPTMRIRAGHRLNVFLTGDLTFAAP